MLLTLLLSFTIATRAQEQITDSRPTLTFFTIDDCSDCEVAKKAWDEMVKTETLEIKVQEVSPYLNI